LLRMVQNLTLKRKIATVQTVDKEIN